MDVFIIFLNENILHLLKQDTIILVKNRNMRL